MVEIRRVSDRVITVVVIFYEGVLRLICGYAPQTGGCLEEKQSLYDELKVEWDKHCAGDLVMCLGDFTGHMGSHIDGFDGVSGGYGVGKRYLEGRMLPLCLEKELCMSSTWF